MNILFSVEFPEAQKGKKFKDISLWSTSKLKRIAELTNLTYGTIHGMSSLATGKL
jgi:hypothetical protein